MSDWSTSTWWAVVLAVMIAIVIIGNIANPGPGNSSEDVPSFIEGP